MGGLNHGTVARDVGLGRQDVKGLCARQHPRDSVERKHAGTLHVWVDVCALWRRRRALSAAGGLSVPVPPLG